MTATALQPGLFTDALLTVLRRGNFNAAADVLASADPAPGDAALASLAQMLVRRRRWAEAAWMFDRLATRDAAAEAQRRLSRNLAALQHHRPEIYERLVGLPAQQRYWVATSPSGQPTVAGRRADGTAIFLSGGPDPLAGAADARARLAAATPAGQCVALCGIGDGYLLAELAAHPPRLFMDMQQPVLLLEPEPQVVLQCLMIHDYTGPRGPIEQSRFRWFTGPDCADDAAATLEDDLFLPFPAVTVRQGMDVDDAAARLQAAAEALAASDADAAARVTAHYARFDRLELSSLLSAEPPRKPRVLLITTRFSTVLQYSTRDSAEAFERLGWDVRTVIEPTSHHRLSRAGLRRALADFLPDLVFQIDHLRHEHGGLFPASLPFACWAQDHLPNLASAAAGAAVGPTDFVLVGMPTMYATRFGYPRRQCLALTKLTRVPQRPATWRADGDDLVYVSSASQQPRDIARQLVAQLARSADAEAFIAACCDRMIAHYAAGRSLPTQYDVRQFVGDVGRDLGVTPGDPAAASLLVDALFDRLGNALYRQQSLRWAADVAQRRGLTLAIYGPGWDAHPDFAAFARGPVAYGPDLEALTRRSRINLVLEPFFSPSHQRLLDGLVAGGFFLVRHHPKNLLMQEVTNFLARHAPRGASTVCEVRAALAPPTAGTFDQLIGHCGPLSEFGDAVEFVRCAEQAGLVTPGDEALPELSAVSFADAATFESRVTEFLGDEGRRNAISQRQRREVEDRLSYASGLGRVVSGIAATLQGAA